jgi:TRAP-type mannitol/chloroaromatic compound transport system substrate-binding protein
MDDRRKFLQAFGVGTAALAASAVTPASAQQTTRWRVAHFAGETSMFYTLTILPFASRVNQLTGGRLQLQPFPGGVIAPPLESYKAVEDGLADAGHLTPLYIVNRDPVNTYFGGHPGGMPPEMLMHWLYNAGGQDLLTQHRRETMKMHSIIVSIGPAEIWHSHKAIKTADDLKGVKFRAAGAWAAILNENFGAAATTVAGSELYTMLERKGVDVVEWSGPAENIKMGLQNAAPYIMVPGPHTNAFAFEFIVPMAKWDALPDDVKKQVEAAAKIATLETLLAWTLEDMEAMKKIRAGKAQIVEVDPSLFKAIREAGRQWAMKRVAEQDAKGNPWMKRITDSYYGFYDSWLQNATYRAAD